ncbi:hypothetical protein AKJ09_10606 [Labilithrix luteola]|uniref:IgGFc-binding protein N-terminal domain-containing protein n=1 Tax=Labilithrix luteola TaxID=1391654 RepID=A0A0K1QDZ5_9BACT|nr:hypothetical protein AKJ09_10606 [Labilithrix luteola]
MSARSPIILTFFVVSAVWVGCSSDRTEFEEARTPEFATNDAATDVDASCTAVSCSRDLRSVLDCNGNVAKICPPELACGNGQCVAPCDSATMNQGSVGCAFSVPGPNTKAFARGSCYAFFVANNWSSPATLRFEFDGQEKPLDGAVWIPKVGDGVVTYTKLDGPIPAGGGAVVFVSNEETGAAYWTACPSFVKPILDKEQGIYATGKGHATLVSSDVPVSMYSMYPYGGASSVVPSATLLFPTSSFRTNYMVVSAWGGKSDGFGRGVLPNANAGLTQAGLPTLQIVATEDGTSVDIRPNVDILGGNGVSAGRRNQVTNYTLQRGEFLQLMQDNELVGAVIDSNKPVGVFGGQSCMFVPSDVMACDIENDQIPPLSAWGHEYAVLPAPNRVELFTQGAEKARDPSPIRILAAADDTQLVYEPAQPEGAPSTLSRGQLGVFFADHPFIVRTQDSDHPVYVASLMTGAATVMSTPIGDPEVAMAVPTDQWLDTYGFFTDYTYSLSEVFVTRRKVDGAFRDVVLDCAGVLEGWKSITDDFEWTYAELTRDGKPRTYPAGSCTDGAHRIHSDGPFAMTVWGLASYASYAYPGGTGLRPVTDIHVPVR